MEKYLTIDIARTKIKYSVVTDSLDILEDGNEYIGMDTKEELFDPIREVCDRYRDEVVGLSISMPGVIDRKKGIAYSGGLFRWVRDMNYAEELSEYVDMPVVICNDAKAAAMAEIGYGSLKNVQNGVLLMILNTGIGGAVITDGHLLNGQHFGAGEFSYIRGDYKNRDEYDDMFALACNLDGFNAVVKDVSGKDELSFLKIMSKVHGGDEDIIRGVSAYCDRLATYIYNIQCVVDADVFVIGGQLSEDPTMMKMIRQGVERKFEQQRYPNVVKPNIKECIFHNKSRTFGAVYNFRVLTGRVKDEL